VLDKIFNRLGLVPPSADATPEQQAQWRWAVTAWVYAITITTVWGFGWTPVPHSPLETVNREVGELKSAVVCSDLKTALERTRSDLYAVQREIEMTPPNELTETVLRRRSELQNTMRDNETRYEKHGCFTVIG